MSVKYADRADFLTIYIKEAHPSDGNQKDSNVEQGVCYLQPKTIVDRLAIVGDFISRFQYAIPLVVDPMENPAELAFGGWPERLYIIGADGRIALQGGEGPKYFAPAEVAAWLEVRPPTPAKAD